MTPIADHPHTNPKRERGSGTTAAPHPNPMGSAALGDESRIMQALQEYRTAREAGANLDRQEFLARHADIATELAQCLDALDFVYEAAPKFQESGPRFPSLAEVADISSSDAASEAQPPMPLGDFRILREIGRGGMGVVYEAEQISLGRRVALKVLPFAAALDSKQLQRFKNEAHAAAGLQHTNIVPVYFVGCERGVHFYAILRVMPQNDGGIVVSMMTEGKHKQRSGRVTFATRSREAPILHFNGPVSVQFISPVVAPEPDIAGSSEAGVGPKVPLKLGKDILLPGKRRPNKAIYLNAAMGTPGLGEGTFVTYKARDILGQPNERIVVEAAFPHRDANAKPIRQQGFLQPDG